MKISRGELITFILVVASFAIGAYIFPMAPEKMASHWNAAGEVNGYMSKFWGIFLMPIISLAMFIVFLLIPRIDPKKENIAKFRRYFDGFIILIFLFFIYIYALTLVWNLIGKFDMIRFLIPAFSFLFYYIGVMVGRAEMNFSIGIRTPWTLSSETVWKKTHILGGKIFKIFGIACLLGVLLPRLAIWIVIAGALCAAFIPMVYSYFIYRRETLKK